MSSTANKSGIADEQVVVALLQGLGQAIMQRDRATLERILSSDFKGTGYNARTVDRDTYIRLHLAPEHDFVQFEPRNIEVRMYGDTAVTFGVYVIHDANLGRGVDHQQFTAVALQRDGTWSLVAYQETLTPTAEPTKDTPEKAIVRKYMEQGWGKGDLSVVDEVVASDVIDHDPFPWQKPGREGWKQALLMIRAVMPDMHIEIEEMVQEGEHVAVRYTCLGTNTGGFQGQPPTGKPMLIRGIGIERVTNGKMSETHRILDIRQDYQPPANSKASIWDVARVVESQNS